jgi:hypothetical protein
VRLTKQGGAHPDRCDLEEEAAPGTTDIDRLDHPGCDDLRGGVDIARDPFRPGRGMINV